MSFSELSSPWEQASESVSLGSAEDRVMLVSGQTFCLCDRSGDIDPSFPHGLFVGDTRALSRFSLTVDGAPVETLGATNEQGWAATFVGRAGRVGQASLLVVQRRALDEGLSGRVELRNHDRQGRAAVVRVELAADFADLFSVKEGRARLHGHRVVSVDERSLRLGWRLGDVRRETRFTTEVDTGGVVTDPRGITWSVTVAGARRSSCDGASPWRWARSGWAGRWARSRTTPRR